jgi:hypothetical protein
MISEARRPPPKNRKAPWQGGFSASIVEQSNIINIGPMKQHHDPQQTPKSALKAMQRANALYQQTGEFIHYQQAAAAWWRWRLVEPLFPRPPTQTAEIIPFRQRGTDG